MFFARQPASKRSHGASRLLGVKTITPKLHFSSFCASSMAHRFPSGRSLEEIQNRGDSITKGNHVRKASATCWLSSPDQLMKTLDSPLTTPPLSVSHQEDTDEHIQRADNIRMKNVFAQIANISRLKHRFPESLRGFLGVIRGGYAGDCGKAGGPCFDDAARIFRCDAADAKDRHFC